MLTAVPTVSSQASHRFRQTFPGTGRKHTAKEPIIGSEEICLGNPHQESVPANTGCQKVLDKYRVMWYKNKAFNRARERSYGRIKM